ncbi:MAG: beta-propeller domain-containing protein [Clostridia bacterium]|nr:beta-propeller domain-containing protein [Clostridia bacterium]
MFEKNYKNAMDNIKADAFVKESVLSKLEAAEEKAERRNPAVIWRVGTALAACVAIVLGVIFIPNNSVKVNAESLTAADSYNEIYKIFEAQNKSSFFDNLLGGLGKDEVYEYYYEYSDTEDAGDTATGTITESSNTSGLKGSQPEGSVNMEESEDAQNEYSETTEQVAGVSEADIVKTDGKNIYYIENNVLNILSAEGKASSLLSKTVITGEYDVMCNEMFLKGNHIIILKTDVYETSGNKTSVVIYDISNPKNPVKVAESCQEGYYTSSRMIGDYIYLISNCPINIKNIDKKDPSTFVPTIECKDEETTVPADSIYRYDDEITTNRYTVIAAYNYKDGTLSGTASLLGGTDQLYCSTENIILANTRYNSKEYDEYEDHIESYTVVSRLAIKDGKLEYKTTGQVDGTLENQFFIDEHKGYFRFVTTVTETKYVTQKFENSDNEFVSATNDTSARLTVLDGELKKIGEIKDLAKGERVYSVRFMGDTAYFVTFRQTDPLFSADLADPKNPKILGELKIPGFSEYMYPYNDGKLLGFGMEADEKTGRTSFLKLSMFNILDPANVTEEDKTVINGYYYSPALNSHKAMMVNIGRNLIGFAATDYDNIKYMLYNYTGEGFENLASIDIEAYYEGSVRGLFVKDGFYIITDTQLKVLDINSFEVLLTLEY